MHGDYSIERIFLKWGKFYESHRECSFWHAFLPLESGRFVEILMTVAVWSPLFQMECGIIPSTNTA